MADEFTIQRVPPGLLNVIGNFGGQTPPRLAQEVIGALELLQYYGLQQRQVLSAANAAIAEGANLTLQLPNTWCVMYAVAFNAIKTATMTALRVSVLMNRGGIAGVAQQSILSEELGPFGATETGAATSALVLPYPMLFPPSSQLIGVCQIIGTDATANVNMSCEVGSLG